MRADGGLRGSGGQSYEKLLVPDGTMLPAFLRGRLGENDLQRQNRLCFSGLSAGSRYRACVHGLNLRASASETAEKLLTIPNGTVVQCYGNKENEWARVAYNGKAGYVSYLYIAYD
ncbi:MAG: SH3 domain-containing protein [Ruthenibacterium lactatiformans]